MHINVHDLLTEELGFSRTFAIEGEQPEMLSLILTQPVNGSVKMTKLEGERLAISGRVTTQLQLECHRCLRSYTLDTDTRFDQIYASRPAEDELPIERDLINLAPLIEQELIVHLPIKLLCQPDCIGVPGAEAYLSDKSTKGTL